MLGLACVLGLSVCVSSGKKKKKKTSTFCFHISCLKVDNLLQHFSISSLDNLPVLFEIP